ncbi:MAG: hypothetical protein ABIQ70_08155, partial [Dokdonella sp.]
SLDIDSLDAAVAPFARSGGTCAPILPFAIAAGATCTLTYVFAPTAAGVDIRQTVAISASVAGDGSFELTGMANFAADQSVTITDNSAYATIGETRDYIVVVSNAGPHTGHSMLTVVDVAKIVGGGTWTCVPTGGATCSGGLSDHVLSDTVVLPAGSSATYVYSVLIPPNDEAQIEMEGVLTVLAPAFDPDFSNDSASDTDAVVIFRDDFDDEATR